MGRKSLVLGNIIRAEPVIQDAYCKCGNLLSEVPDGFLSSAWYCKKCENIYTLKLVKVPIQKITKGYLEHCRNKTRDKK